MPEPQLLRTLTQDGVLVLTLNRPEAMNALSGELAQGLISAARETTANDAIRVVVVTGNGRGFCAGADLSGGGPTGGGGGSGRTRAVLGDTLGSSGALVKAFAQADVPVIAAINGAAVGAGFGIALCCDVRIASDQARMGSIFIKRGIATDYGVSWWLPRLVGPAKAFDLLYSGEILDAQTLLGLGLVNRVVPHESLMDEVLAYARMIASGPPLGYMFTRRNVQLALDSGMDAQIEFEWRNQREALSSQDAAEGFRAFAERRAPKFTGR